MKFKCGGNELPVIDYTLRESFDLDYSVLRFSSLYGANGIVEVDMGGATAKMVVNNIDYVENHYEMTAIPAIVASLNQGVCPAFKEDEPKTFQQICQFYGIPAAFREDSKPHYIEFPEMKVTELLRRFNYVFDTGSSPVMTVTAVGSLLLIDLEQTLGVGKESANRGELLSMNWRTYQDLDVPQTLKLTLQTMTEPDKDIELKGEKQHGSSNVVEFVTIDKLSYLPELTLRNKQGVMRYTSAHVKLISHTEISPVLGTCYEYDGVKFVLTESVITPRQVILTLSRNAY